MEVRVLMVALATLYFPCARGPIGYTADLGGGVVVSDDDGLVGRTDEQGALSEVLAATHQHAERVVLLAGEAGVGKTRLLDV